MHLRSYSSGGTTKFLTWTWYVLKIDMGNKLQPHPHEIVPIPTVFILIPTHIVPLAVPIAIFTTKNPQQTVC